MLVKLTPGVDFTNILCTAFTCADPKSAKKDCQLDCLFALLGSGSIKAARKMLYKLTPGSVVFLKKCNVKFEQRGGSKVIIVIE